MNREIKFEHMLIRDSKVIRKETFKLTEAKPDYALIDGMSEVFRQFTGLYDRNGQEIYEGDVLRWLGFEVCEGKQVRPKRIHIVDGGNWIVSLHRTMCLVENNNSVEVIGNIYENPELLEPK